MHSVVPFSCSWPFGLAHNFRPAGLSLGLTFLKQDEELSLLHKSEGTHACLIACEDMSLPKETIVPGNNMAYEDYPKVYLSVGLRLSLKGAKPMWEVLSAWLC